MMDEAIDYLGCPIYIGDTVVFVQLNYRNLLKGTILKITPKMLVISHPSTSGGTGVMTTRQNHNQVVVVTGL